MREVFWCVKAEIVKMRHTFLYPLHLLLPALGSGIFLLYYRVSSWSAAAQISGYVEAVGVMLPFAVSLVCGGSVALEEKNCFQTFLSGSVRKGNAFLAKFLVLSGMGILAVLEAVFLFGAGYGCISGKTGLSPGAYGEVAAALCLGSIPLYLEHLFLNLSSTRAVSLGVSVAQALLAALFLTGLGDGRWFFFPCTWSARGSALLLAWAGTKEGEGIWPMEMKGIPVVCLLLPLALCVIIGIWFHFYEGRRGND